MVALGVVLLAGALLAGYGAWVKFSVQSTILFEERYRARQVAREGVGLGIALLMEDDVPDVDWLGEGWAGEKRSKVGSDMEADIRIWDEGSLLGLNWMEPILWAELPGMTPEKVDAAEALRLGPGGALHGGNHPFFGSAGDLVSIGLTEDEITHITGMTTSFAPFNVNAVRSDILHILFTSVGYSSSQARAFTDRIESIRSERRFDSIDELAELLLGPGRMFPNNIRIWLDVSGPINVNTAPADVLQRLFKAYGHSEDFAGQLVEARKTEPLRSLSDVERLLGERLSFADGGLHPVARWLTFQSRFFRIESRAGSPQLTVIATIHRHWDADASQWETEIISWNEGG